MLLAFASIALPHTAHAITEKERAEAFKWFDTLGYPDVQPLIFIEATTGSWTVQPNLVSLPETVHGFLLKDNNRQFTILTANLSTLTFKKGVRGKPEVEPVGFEKRDFAKWAEELLASESKRSADADDNDNPTKRVSFHEGPIDPARKTRLFVAARWCERKGQEELAFQLSELAGGVVDQAARDDETPRSFKASLWHDLAGVQYEHILAPFTNAQVSYAELLAMFEAYVKHFPGTESIETAIYTRDLLRQMAAEEAEHAKRTTKTWEQSSVAERLAELIYRLRHMAWDETGAGWPAAAFSDLKTDESPYALIVNMGFDAVPALIEAVDDRRFTREWYQRQKFDHAHRVKRVGDQALDALEHIAGRRFLPSINTEPAPGRPRGKDAQTEARQWWAQMKAKGEKQVLIEAVASADLHSVRQALRLVERYPDAAVEPLLKALQVEVVDQEVYRHLLGVAGDLKDERIATAIRRVAKEAPIFDRRLRAGQVLLKRDDPAGLITLIREFEAMVGDAQEQALNGYELIRVLIHACEPAAVECLAKHLPTFDVKLRSRTIRLLDERPVLGYHMIPDRPEPPVVSQKQAKVAAECEAMLIALLNDTAEHSGLRTHVLHKGQIVQVSNPRIDDLAANKLSRLWPDRYAFDIRQAIESRDRQRQVMRETFLKRQEAKQPREPSKE